MHRLIAAVRRVEDRPARELEVPVRTGGLPGNAAVACFEDLLETDVHMIGVGRIDRNHLVVPGLHAWSITDIELERRSGRCELLRVGDFVPRTDDCATRRCILTR